MLKQYSIYFILIIVVVFSCNRYPSEVKVALRLAGKNKGELKEVLKYYEGETDSLKLRAAEYIVGLLPHKFHFENGDSDSILTAFNQNLPEQKELYLERNISFEIIYDSLLFYHPEVFHRNDPRMDIYIITSEMLIENIEYAFYVWENMPWAKKLSFDHFKDYILPYKCLNTKPEFWRKKMFNEYKWVLDSMKSSDDPVEACILINECLKKDYTHHAKVNPNNLSQMINLQGGGCTASSVYACYVMRAMGIPTNIANTLIAGYPPFEGRHVENYLLTKNLELLRFQGCLKSPYEHQEWQDDFRGKWFYESEEVNSDWITEIISKNKEVPTSLQNNKLVDITGAAAVSYDIAFGIDSQIDNEISDDEYAFLCVSTRRGGWTAIDYAKIENDSVVFSGITPGVYFPMRYYNSKFHLLADPVKLSIGGKIVPLLENESKTTEKQTLKLYRKYPMNQHEKQWSAYLLGDKIQCANDSLFLKPTTIHTITDSTLHVTDVFVNDTNTYKYIRYKIETYNSATKMVELKFYGLQDGKEVELTGDTIYYPKNEPRLLEQFEHAFDDDYWTFFHLDPFTPQIDDLWFGFELEKPMQITKIRYMCHSALNCIVPGNAYELNYLEGANWIQTKTKEAKDVFVEFQEVPSNRIYLLKNLTEGIEEYFFTCEEGEQVWW